MDPVVATLSVVAALCAVAGIVQALAGLAAARRFAAKAGSRDRPRHRPAITILKPLCGDEPLLEQALGSLCAIDYPDFQIVCGVSDPADPAVAVVRRVQQTNPARDIALVVGPAPVCANRKVGNLLSMLPVARHDLLLIGDSDVHVAPDYLDAVAAAFERDDAGLVTTLYAGLPGNGSLAAMLGATWISHTFLPGVLLARAGGRQDALGVTMAIRRETLTTVGGLQALGDGLADDAELGRRVRALGLPIVLAPAMTATTVPESGFPALLRHELRWARTIGAVAPVGFALSAVQFPIAWAVLAFALSGASRWALALLLAAWAVRAACAVGIDRALRLSARGMGAPPPVLLLPLRDLLSLGVHFASYAGTEVEWRGQRLRTRSEGNGGAFGGSGEEAARSAG